MAAVAERDVLVERKEKKEGKKEFSVWKTAIAEERVLVSRSVLVIKSERRKAS